MAFYVEVNGSKNITVQEGEKKTVQVFTDQGISVGSSCRVELQHSMKPNVVIHDGTFTKLPDGRLYCGFYWTPTTAQIGSWSVRAYDSTGYPSSTTYVVIEGVVPVKKWLTVRVLDAENEPVPDVQIKISGVTKGYTGSDGSFATVLDYGEYYAISAIAPDGYDCVDCFESVTMTDDRLVDFTVRKEPIPTCRIDFSVTEVDPSKRVAGAKCIIDGKTCITDSQGVCSINVECGKPYKATCEPPDDYTCDCGVCICHDSFTPTGDGLVSFILRKVVGECTVLFEVVDSETNIPAVGIEIAVDGKTLITDMNGQATIDLDCNKTYIAQCKTPEGYVCAGECTRSFTPKISSWIPFQIRYPEEGEFVITAPSTVTAEKPFSVDVLYEPNKGVDIVVKSVLTYQVLGHGETDADGRCSVAVVLRSTGEKEVWAQTSPLKKSNKVKILVVKEEVGEDVVTLDIPSVAMAGEIEVSGRAEGLSGVVVEIMRVQRFWGMMNDVVVKTLITDSEGNYAGTLPLDEFGFFKMYAKTGKYPVLTSDKHSIMIITTTVLLMLAVMVALVAEKRFAVIGIFNKKR